MLPSENKTYEKFDSLDQPMFDRCVAAHGPLERGECYGYFPAVATVGLDRPAGRLESIKRVKALEHFAVLAQLGTFHLMKLERGAYVVTCLFGGGSPERRAKASHSAVAESR